MSNIVNDFLFLVGGKAGSGKSASLMNIDNPGSVMYLNCESGKRLPFKSGFKEYTVTDPIQVNEAFVEAENMPDIDTIIVDSLTYLMDMFESTYVLGSSNTMQGWSDYAQYFKNLMQQLVAKSTKNVIFLAHVKDQVNETEMVTETAVPIKGSLKNNGIESYFSCVLAAKKVSIKKLEDYSNDLLVITPEEQALGYKHVFQTRLTKDSVNDRIRGPIGLWSVEETYIDNDAQKVINRLREYYS